jgi:hypothetical protein
VLVVGRARPGVSYNNNKNTSCARCNARSQPWSSTQPKEFLQPPQKGSALIPYTAVLSGHQTQCPRLMRMPCPAQAFVHIERRFVACLPHALRSSFMIAGDECRGSSFLWFQRTSDRAANLRSRPFHQSFDMASWWVGGSHTNAHWGSTSTAILLALDQISPHFWGIFGYLPKRSASCRRGPPTRP